MPAVRPAHACPERVSCCATLPCPRLGQVLALTPVLPPVAGIVPSSPPASFQPVPGFGRERASFLTSRKGRKDRLCRRRGQTTLTLYCSIPSSGSSHPATTAPASRPDNLSRRDSPPAKCCPRYPWDPSPAGRAVAATARGTTVPPPAEPRRYSRLIGRGSSSTPMRWSSSCIERHPDPARSICCGSVHANHCCSSTIASAHDYHQHTPGSKPSRGRRRRQPPGRTASLPAEEGTEEAIVQQKPWLATSKPGSLWDWYTITYRPLRRWQAKRPGPHRANQGSLKDRHSIDGTEKTLAHHK
jgi:hypothetical protein